MRPSKGEMLRRLEVLEDNVQKLREDLRDARRTNRQLQFVLDELAKNHGWLVEYREEGFYLTPRPERKEEPYGN